jgi:hypothetical protein
MMPQYCPPATLQLDLGWQMPPSKDGHPPLSGRLTIVTSGPMPAESRWVTVPESSVTLGATDPPLWQPAADASTAMDAIGMASNIGGRCNVLFDMNPLLI